MSPLQLPAALAAAAVLLLAAPRTVRGQQAPAGPAPAAVVEAREDASGEVQVLLDRGRAGGVEPGLSVEVQREGRTVAYGSVTAAFTDLAVANVGTIVTGASPLRAGDAVLFRGRGFPPPGPQPAETAAPPLRGKVVGVREDMVMLDLGGGQGVEIGSEVSVRAPEGPERGRLTIELVDAGTAVGVLLQGEAHEGDIVVVLGRVERTVPEGNLDFVALSFLGVVADLEHPTPHRAPCHVGVPVRRVLRGAPARAAGIGPGDRVIGIDGVVVRDVSDIRARIEAREGPRVRVTILRGDVLRTLNVEFR